MRVCFFKLIFLCATVFVLMLSCSEKKTAEETSQTIKDSVALKKKITGLFHQMQSNPLVVREESIKMLPESEKLGVKSLIFDTYQLIITTSELTRSIDLQEKYISEAKEKAKSLNDSTSIYRAKFLESVFLVSQNRDTEAMKLLLETADYFKNRENTHYANCLTMLASLTLRKNDYEMSNVYGKEIIKIAKKLKSPLSIALSYGNVAGVEAAQNNVEVSEKYIDSAEALAQKHNLQIGILGAAKGINAQTRGNYEKAIDFYDQLLKAVYDPLIVIRKAACYLEMKNYDAAFKTINELENSPGNVTDNIYWHRDLLALKMQFPDRYYSPKEKTEFVRNFYDLNQQVKASDNSMAVSRYLYKQEKLNSEKIELQKDLLTQQVYRQNFLIASIVIISLLSALLYYNYTNRRKKILENKILTTKLETIKTERNRVSQELHDDLGIYYTNILLASELFSAKNAESREVEIIRSNTQKIYQKSRDIIWSLNTQNDTLGNLSAYIHRFAKEFLQDKNIVLKFNTNSGEQENYPVNALVRRRIYFVVQEVLNNAVKHSGATEISLDILLKEPGLLTVNISDNGKGFDAEAQKTGQGLKNIEKNISELKNSTYEFQSGSNGTQYNFEFDISEEI